MLHACAFKEHIQQPHFRGNCAWFLQQYDLFPVEFANLKQVFPHRKKQIKSSLIFVFPLYKDHHVWLWQKDNNFCHRANRRKGHHCLSEQNGFPLVLRIAANKVPDMLCPGWRSMQRWQVYYNTKKFKFAFLKQKKILKRKKNDFLQK